MSLRILHVTPYAEGAWAYGGIPRLTSTLTRALARRGHHVTVCSTDACSADARLPKARADDDVALRVFPNVSNHLAYHWQCFTPLGFGAYMREHFGRDPEALEWAARLPVQDYEELIGGRPGAG